MIGSRGRKPVDQAASGSPLSLGHPHGTLEELPGFPVPQGQGRSQTCQFELPCSAACSLKICSIYLLCVGAGKGVIFQKTLQRSGWLCFLTCKSDLLFKEDFPQDSFAQQKFTLEVMDTGYRPSTSEARSWGRDSVQRGKDPTRGEGRRRPFSGLLTNH